MAVLVGVFNTNSFFGGCPWSSSLGSWPAHDRVMAGRYKETVREGGIGLGLGEVTDGEGEKKLH